MESILKKLNSIQPDKLAHALVGSIVFAVAHLFVSVLWSIAAVILVAALKELYDSANQDKHTVDQWDFVATVAGCIPCLLSTVKIL